ncbi:MAG: glycosyltransferase family 4 protein [Bacteroidales bacterium]
MPLSVLMLVASEDDGGMARVVHLLASNLSSFDIRVHVAVHREAPLTDWLRQAAVPNTVLPTLIETPTRRRDDGATGLRASLENLAGLPSAVRAVRTLAAAVHADVIYSHNTWSHYVAAIAAALPGLKPRPTTAPEAVRPAVVWHIHNDHSHRATRALDRLAARIGSVGAVLAVSDSIGAPFRNRPAPLTVVTNGIDIGACDRARREPGLRAALGLGASSVVAVYAGRLVPHKGIHVLLEAARIAVAQVPELHVAVLGGTPRHAPNDVLAGLRNSVNAWRLGTRIHFLGHVADAQRYVADADIALIPSVCADGYPLAAVEALCLGVPVIASDVGGLPQLVRDGVDGLLFPPGDARALADALVSLARDPQRRHCMSQAAEAGRHRFDATTMARRVAEALHRAAGRRMAAAG